jgi:hypothetical protein
MIASKTIVLTMAMRLIAGIYGFAYDLPVGKSVVCTQYSVINGPSMTVCSMNSTLCQTVDKFVVEAWQCNSFLVTQANVTSDDENLKLFFSQPKNYLISVIILIFNIVAALLYGMYKWYQKRKKANEPSPLTAPSWRRDANGAYYLDESGGDVGNDENIRLNRITTLPGDEEIRV